MRAADVLDSLGPFPSRRPLLVASDLDGTLLPLGGEVHPRVAAGVAALRAAGVRFVICTGRMLRSARPVALRLGVCNGTIVCYQGALVADLATHHALLSRPVPSGLAAEVVAAVRSLGRHAFAFVNDELHVEQADQWTRLYEQRSGVTAVLDDDLEASVRKVAPHKLLVLTEPEEALALVPQLRERWSGMLMVSLSQPGYIELTAAGATKAAALEFLARRAGVPRSRTLACGDGQNDLDMLQWADFAVAMAEASPEVRSVARLVLPQAEVGALFERLAALPQR
jgi:Cof subfamily protein (haloacid dehalogenase superfamily)